MTTARGFAAKLDPLAVFEARAEARAYLWRAFVLDLPEAVDVLQADAKRDGLVARLGQDQVQQILAKAFGTPPVAAVILDYPMPRRHRAAESIVEAVMYALRQNGIGALHCGHTRQRITELSDAQLEAIVVRLARLRGTYPKVTDGLLLELAGLLDG